MCRVLAPEGSAFFWSSCFAAPRLLPCCSQLAEVKPCPKCPCIPSESNLGFIAAILFPSAIWGQGRRTRNCPSLGAVPCACRSRVWGGPAAGLSLSIPGEKTQLGRKDRTAWPSLSQLILLQQKLCPIPEMLLPEQFLALPRSLLFLGPLVLLPDLSAEGRSSLSELATISSLAARGLLGWFPCCLCGPGMWSLLASLWWWPLSHSLGRLLCYLFDLGEFSLTFNLIFAYWS